MKIYSAVAHSSILLVALISCVCNVETETPPQSGGGCFISLRLPEQETTRETSAAYAQRRCGAPIQNAVVSVIWTASGWFSKD